jgi:hypothetical protein
MNITSEFNTNPLVFRPIFSINNLSGFRDIQMGRPTPLSIGVTKEATTQDARISDARVMHGLSISVLSPYIPNIIATFQDFTDINPSPNTYIAYNESTSTSPSY